MLLKLTMFQALHIVPGHSSWDIRALSPWGLRKKDHDKKRKERTERGAVVKDSKGERQGREEIWTPTCAEQYACDGAGDEDERPGWASVTLSHGRWCSMAKPLYLCWPGCLQGRGLWVPPFFVSPLWEERIFSESLNSTSLSLSSTKIRSETFRHAVTSGGIFCPQWQGKLLSLVPMHFLIGLQKST